MTTSRVGIVIPVLNGARELKHLLPILKAEPGDNTILIIDSQSTDGTEEAVSTIPNIRWHQISRSEFNHGATRELGRRMVGTEIVVFLTQDVIPEPGFLARLVEPVTSGRASVSYSRQRPHDGARFFEAFPREYNYPDGGNIRSLEDAPKYGVYAFFCSDSAAAYSNAALDSIGGFEPILTNEDYFAVAKLLKAGHRIAYVSDSIVRHSHSYTLKDEFRRYFDTGYVRAEHRWVTSLVGQAEGRGAAFARTMLASLAREAPWLIPYALLQIAAKWLGYRVGFFSYRLSRGWCRRLSSQRYYWGSVHCRHPAK